jgi:hypothetical protein
MRGYPAEEASAVRLGVVLVAAMAVAAVFSGAASAADASLELARRYSPIVRLVEQKEPCAHGEAYVPTNVGRVLGSAEVALRGPWDTINVVKVAPTGADLAQGLFDYHLDFPGDAVTPGCKYDQWSHRINSGWAPRTYARVATDPGFPNKLALEYWFFYVFNDFNDKHEGDWEMVQLDFDVATPAEALRTKPSLVGYSQHEGAESAHWGDSKLQIVDGTHPVVYPALGSHANYYTSALHLGRSAAQGVGCDDTSDASHQLRPKVSLVPSGRTAYLPAYPWLGFQGHWGEEHRGFYNGPTGPTTKTQWDQPIRWATDDWRDTSFVVPAGNAIGSTATGFFCGAVETGSNLLTALVGNPSPVLLALTVIFGLLLWLTSRTEWHPSAPLRLERRRTWGSIVNAGRRMYFGHLRLFLGIGLLFFPLGALVTVVQYLVFRVSGVNALVDSVGSTNALVDFLAVALGVLFTIFGLCVVGGATAIAMVELDGGRKVTALAAYRKGLPRLRSLLGAALLASAAIAIVSFTAFGIVLSVWLIVRWAFLAQVVALENVSAFSALHRSANLVRGNWWRVASMVLFVVAVALLLGPLFGTLLLFVSSASFDFINLVSALIYTVVLPFAAIAMTYLYFDRRVAKRYEQETAETGDVLPADVPSAAMAPN